MTTPSPTVRDAPDAHRFELHVGDELAGYAEYHRRPGVISFTHTVVEPQFGGQGLGSVLARAALDRSREAGDAVLPYCPFIRGFIQRHPEYVDLVPEERRGEFGLADEG